jgi:hypothetical protein
MTKDVRSILIEARQRLARKVLTCIHFQDTNALSVLDQLLLSATIQDDEEAAKTAPSINTEAVEATPNCKAAEANEAEDATPEVIRELEAAKLEIARLNKLREQDSRIIEGLRKGRA